MSGPTIEDGGPDGEAGLAEMGEPVVSVFILPREDGATQVATGVDPEHLTDAEDMGAVMAQVMSVLAMAIASQDDGEARATLAEMRLSMDRALTEDLDVLLPPATLN